MQDAWGFWHMTPAEAKGRMKAYSARLEQDIGNYDALAWMIGNYAACAYHDPKHYPKKPNMVKERPRKGVQDEENMKDLLMTYAEIHNEVEVRKHGGKT